MTTIAGVPALTQKTRELTFVEQGLLGFESLLRYELAVYDPETPFYWLRSLEDPEVAFIVMEPCWLLDDYAFELSDEDARLLDVKEQSDVFVMVLCTIPENPLEMTANLLGPLVFNHHNNLGRQLILDRHRFPVRFEVFQQPDRAEADPGAEAEAESSAKADPGAEADSATETP